MGDLQPETAWQACVLNRAALLGSYSDLIN